MTQTSDNVTWLTQEAYDRLKAELDYLQGPYKVEIARKIEAAREEGDLRENGGYHAAKEEQGKMHARALQLAQMLEKAQVGVPPTTASGTAAPGMVVKIAFDGDDDDTLEFLLGSREASATDIEVYSPQSPLGSAINGHKVGESASYELPNGKSISVKLLSAEPYTG